MSTAVKQVNEYLICTTYWSLP